MAAALSDYLTHLPQTHFQTKSNRWTKWFLVGGQWEVGQFDGVTLHQSGFFSKTCLKSCLWDHYLSRAAGTAKKPLCPSWSWARSGLSRLQTWYNIVINIVQYTAQDQLAMLGDKEN